MVDLFRQCRRLVEVDFYFEGGGRDIIVAEKFDINDRLIIFLVFVSVFGDDFDADSISDRDC